MSSATGPRFQKIGDYAYVDTEQISVRDKRHALDGRLTYHIPITVRVGEQHFRVGMSFKAKSIETAMKAALVSAQHFHDMEDAAKFDQVYIKKVNGDQSLSISFKKDDLGMLRGHVGGHGNVSAISKDSVIWAERIAWNMEPILNPERTDKRYHSNATELVDSISKLKEKAESLTDKSTKIDRDLLQKRETVAKGKADKRDKPFISGLQDEIKALQAQKKLLASTLAKTISEIDALSAKVSTLATAFASLERSMNKAEGAYEGAQKQLDRANENLQKAPDGRAKRRAESRLNQHKAKLSSRETTFRRLEDTVLAREAELGKLHEEFDRLQSLVYKMSGEEPPASPQEKNPGLLSRMTGAFTQGASGLSHVEKHRDGFKNLAHHKLYYGNL